MGVLKEIWTGELLNHFRHEGTWMSRIRDRSELVNNNVIHLVDVGADPGVLINNTTYPIAVVSREDGDVPISLDKFDTENTSVSKDELYAISYDKMASVIDQHKEVLEEKTLEKGLHALAPQSNTAKSPVLPTTGSAVNGLKQITTKDFSKMKRKFDDLKIPKKDRIAVLCNEHIEMLLNTDESFEKQYKDNREGRILKLYGFEIYEDAYNPVYNGTTGVKVAFGAAPQATDRNASVFFYAGRAFRAKGSAEMFWSEANKNPQLRKHVVGFQQYFICLPKKNEGFGAIYTANE